MYLQFAGAYINDRSRESFTDYFEGELFMDVSQVGSYVDKIKEFTLKNKVAVAAATAAVLVLGVGYQVYQSQPKSLVAAVQVEFTGYDGFGELSYDSKEIIVE